MTGWVLSLLWLLPPLLGNRSGIFAWWRLPILIIFLDSSGMGMPMTRLLCRLGQSNRVIKTFRAFFTVGGLGVTVGSVGGAVHSEATSALLVACV